MANKISAVFVDSFFYFGGNATYKKRIRKGPKDACSQIGIDA